MKDFESFIKIKGGQALRGEVSISGAKNSALPLLFATLLAEGRHEFENVPQLKDVQWALDMLSSLGLSHKREGDQLLVENFNLKSADKPCSKSAGAFRASVLCLGPLLARLGSVKLFLPGGCKIGARPVDFHLKGLSRMGAEFKVEDGYIYGSVPKKIMRGAEIRLDFPSVGATENLILASVLAQGETRLRNTACEPEILDLISYLRGLGAQIEQISSRESKREFKGEEFKGGELKITGVKSLKLKPKQQPYRLIPDRIEAGTFLLAGACSKGSLKIKNCCPEHLNSLLEKLKVSGFEIESKKAEVCLKSPGRGGGKAVQIKTGVYPSFPTDLQSQFTALMSGLNGLSSLEETIFENRFRYVDQLNRLGAGIQFENPQKIFIKGPVDLTGQAMEAGDLRAGAGLVLAALSARGESRVFGLSHIERGYEHFPSKLQSLGADLELCSS